MKFVGNFMVCICTKFQIPMVYYTAINLKGKYKSLAAAISLPFIPDKDCSQ
jgi:hypothetical protein